MRLSLCVEVSIISLLIEGMILARYLMNAFKSSTQRQLVRLIILAMIQNISDLAWAFVAELHIRRIGWLFYLINIMYFLASTLMSVSWFIYCESILKKTYRQTRIRKTILYFPCITAIIMILSSVFFGTVFSISPEGAYVRGPLYAIYIAFAYSYLFFGAFRAIIASCNKKYFMYRSEYLSLVMFAAMPLIGGLIQIVFAEIPLLTPGIALSIILIYIEAAEKRISLDPLTKLHNRNQLYPTMESKMNHPDADKRLYLLMFDIDYFKLINDKFGHVEGDNALIRAAKVLDIVGKMHGSFASRYGGDEFMIVTECKEETEVAAMFREIREMLEKDNASCDSPFNVRFSMGYAKYDRSMTSIQDFIAVADKNLYENKEHRPSPQSLTEKINNN